MSETAQEAKVEFRGKTRQLVSNHADAAFVGSEEVNRVLNREKTNAVVTSQDEIDELQRLLEEIKDSPNYNGHMENYVRRTKIELEAARPRFF